ncbi:MAG TPA: pyridoxamine 5'-phosphate oxidase [Verrucomicrobiota bacterium]|nr:pyridoxamine 5'-phosphate oxidase [Verrucomicrobiota bacterium]HNT14789.1 pyridoxamine 5'-phosphate oxidase [Verrucomicrobiota bacterium]
MAIADIRREYKVLTLDETQLDPDPLRQFSFWLEDAIGTQGRSRWRRIGIALYKLGQALLGRSGADVNAMTLATVGADGHPSSRTVLLKGIDERGFIFFTNYTSRKGTELESNPHAALTFYWPEFERQVCVAGKVSKVSREESEAYFKSRPRDSQLGAWASAQSHEVASRAELEARWEAVARQYPGEVPLPPFWGGFALRVERIEFWQGRPGRLHDRLCYWRLPAGGWRVGRLSP